jgi:ribonuclease HII
MLKQFYEKDKIEVGIDEAGRGCLLGPVCVAAVILSDLEDNPPPFEIKDSKKVSEKRRKILRKYIEENALAYSIQLISESEIDEINILQATVKGMHLCVTDILKQMEIDTILVDGNYFNIYNHPETGEPMNHVCVKGGDNEYLNIAAASILAKDFRDEYMINLVKENECLEKYGIIKNKGYGTKIHMNAIKENGLTEWHRKSYKI